MIDLLDNDDLNNHRPTHIYDMLNPEGQLQQEHDLAVGAQDDPKFESFAYTGNLGQQGNAQLESFKYRKIILPCDEERKYLTLRLVPEQMNILSKVVGFCKDVAKSRRNIEQISKPLNLIIHGGAGKKIISKSLEHSI